MIPLTARSTRIIASRGLSFSYGKDIKTMDFGLHFAAKHATEETTKVMAFRDQVTELAKKLFIARKDFDNDMFALHIEQAITPVLDTELDLIQGELLSAMNKEKEK
jgi:hypothetical protein